MFLQYEYLPDLLLDFRSMGVFVVILLQNDVGKLLLMLSCANRKFDNLMLSANFKILHLLYKGLTDGPGGGIPQASRSRGVGSKTFF